MTQTRARTILRPGAVITQAAWPAAAVRRLHIASIGGAGMSAVARLALDAGLEVTGTDPQDGQFIAPLRELGASIHIGPGAPDLAEGTDLVVVSTAVRPDNAQVIRARERSIPVIHRAAALAGLLGERPVIAVAGTHGKTSTTAMTVLALRGAGIDPAWALGAAVPALGHNAGFAAEAEAFGAPSVTDAAPAVVEADESDGSFVAFAPQVVVVTNLEADHLDFHGSAENVAAAFDALVGRIVPGGVLIVCADDPGAAALGQRARERGVQVQTYGRAGQWGIGHEEPTATGTEVAFTREGREVAAVTLSVFGHHNVLNALGALAAAAAAAPAAGPQDLAEGIAPFTGASRRFEKRGTERGVTVYDDYAHHPSEVAATVAAARGIAGSGRVIVAFQPHLFSRTRAFAADFARALGGADLALVLPVYAAREDPDPAVSAATITEAADSAARASGRLVALADRCEAAPRIAGAARAGDVVLMLGAGDIVEETGGVLAAIAASAEPAEDPRESSH